MTIKNPFKIGIGYDVHKLVEGRKLILGGVEIQHEKGLLGHSDADVLTHAIMDAILGALGMGDIGKHFPDTDETYKDSDSLVLLSKVGELMEGEGYTIGNIDGVIIAQRPKCAPHIPKMVEKLSETLKVPSNTINIKATTEEWLGFTGREEGIASQAVVLLNHIQKEDKI